MASLAAGRPGSGRHWAIPILVVRQALIGSSFAELGWWEVREWHAPERTYTAAASLLLMTYAGILRLSRGQGHVETAVKSAGTPDS
ncbi:hypothetical protein GCM10020220_077150 [Nonomuraea rubra]